MGVPEQEKYVTEVRFLYKDFVDYLLANDRLLTTTGVQYNVDDADAVATTVQSTEKTLYEITLDRRYTDWARMVNWIDFVLTAAFIQITGAVNGVIKWYVKSVDGAYVLMHTSAATALTAAMVDYTCSGRWQPSAELTYPIVVKLTLTTDGAANMGKGKIKSSSLVGVSLR